MAFSPTEHKGDPGRAHPSVAIGGMGIACGRADAWVVVVRVQRDVWMCTVGGQRDAWMRTVGGQRDAWMGTVGGQRGAWMGSLAVNGMLGWAPSAANPGGMANRMFGWLYIKMRAAGTPPAGVLKGRHKTAKGKGSERPRNPGSMECPNSSPNGAGL